MAIGERPRLDEFVRCGRASPLLSRCRKSDAMRNIAEMPNSGRVASPISSLRQRGWGVAAKQS
jgi:hypothetical protein